MAPGQPADRDNRGEPDWSDLVKRIQARTYLSQKQIAERCKVARQTVSAWVHRRRKPGLYAKRELVILAAEGNILDDVIPSGEPDTVSPSSQPGHGQAGRQVSEPTDVGQLGLLFTQLSPGSRKEVLEFAKFKVLQERG